MQLQLVIRHIQKVPPHKILNVSYTHSKWLNSILRQNRSYQYCLYGVWPECEQPGYHTLVPSSKIISYAGRSCMPWIVYGNKTEDMQHFHASNSQIFSWKNYSIRHSDDGNGRNENSYSCCRHCTAPVKNDYRLVYLLFVRRDAANNQRLLTSALRLRLSRLQQLL